MNLYLLSQDINHGYDTYDSFVVCAQSEEKAKIMTPDELPCSGAWTNPEYVKVRLIGRAAEHIKEGAILCSSYNAS